MTVLDEKDLKILEALSANSKLSTYQVSKQTGIPTTTVHNRIKRLEDEKIIKAYTIDVDHEKLGKDVIVFLLSTYDMNKMEQAGMSLDDLTKKLKQIPEVEELSYVTGRFDMIIKLRLKSVGSLSQVVLDEIRKIPGVLRTESIHALFNTRISRI